MSSLLNKPVDIIKSVKDLLDSSLKVGSEDILYSTDYLKNTNDSVVRELYLKKFLGKGNNSNFITIEEGLELTRKGHYAFHVDVDAAYPIITATFPEQAICELRELEMIPSQRQYATYQKNSPFHDLFDTWYFLFCLVCSLVFH